MKKYFDNIYNKSYDTLFNKICRNLDNKKRTFIVTANPNTLMCTENDTVMSDILLDKNILATFFMDGSVVENNMAVVLELSSNGNQIENLGYDGKYSLERFGWTNNMISSLTNKDTKFCYTDYKNSEILELCSDYKMYTVKPTISVNNYPFTTVKKELESGSIISFNLNETTLKELPSIITYIKQKGYNIVTLNQLISEKLVEEK